MGSEADFDSFAIKVLFLLLQAPLGHRAFYMDLQKANSIPEDQEPEWLIEYDTAVTLEASLLINLNVEIICS